MMGALRQRYHLEQVAFIGRDIGPITKATRRMADSRGIVL